MLGPDPAKQVLFRNPLEYILAREGDLYATGDCHDHDDTKPARRFPVQDNLGLVYYKSSPALLRCQYNW
jgi:hypothetical protein